MARAAKKNSHNDGKPITIKKYANRRLYHTQKSAYVTLEDLATMVRDDEDFVVIDAKSGDDITRSVLSQIIFDAEAKGENMLPPSFLRQIISLYGGAMQSLVPGYLESTMDHFMRNQERVRDNFEKNFGMNPAMAGFETIARANMEWFERSMRMFGSNAAKTDVSTGDNEKDKELAALKAELKAMQDKLAKLSDN